MSKLDDLINELCPNGVEYKTLGEICDILRGRRLTTRDLIEDGEYPVFHGGIEPIGYYNQKNRDGYSTMVINVGASAGTIGFCDKDFWSSDGCFCFSHTETLNQKFLFYVLQSNEHYLKSKVRKAGIPTLDNKEIERFQIPVPPLSIQNEIIHILDNFTELEEELEEELEARRRQYEWAKQKLLNIKKDNLVELQSVCRLEKGKTPIQKAIPGEYPLVVTTDKRSSCKDYQFDCKAVCLSLVSARGHGIAQISRIFYQEGKFALGNILCAMIPNDENQLNAKFLQYYLFYMKDILLTPLMKGGANVALHISDLQTVKIPLPPIQEQEKIVSFLNKFDELCNDETTGLPAEIEARKKQYEYYRDKLLSFKRIGE